MDDQYLTEQIEKYIKLTPNGKSYIDELRKNNIEFDISKRGWKIIKPLP